MDLEYLKKKYLGIPEGSLMQAGKVRGSFEHQREPAYIVTSFLKMQKKFN